MSQSILKYKRKSDQIDYYFLFSNSGIFSGTNMPMTIPLDLSSFISFQFNLGNNLSYLKEQFIILESNGTLIKDFNWKSLPWLEDFIEDLILESGTHLLAVENETLTKKIKDWLLNESIEYEDKWLINEVINFHKSFNKPSHFFLSWHYTTKYLENCKLSKSKIIIDGIEKKVDYKYLIINGYHPLITPYLLSLIKKVIKKYNMPLEYVPHNLRMHPDLKTVFIKQREVNLFPITLKEIETSQKGNITPIHLSPSRDEWKQHIQELILGDYKQGYQIKSLLSSFEKKIAELTDKELTVIRKKFNLRGKDLILLIDKKKKKIKPPMYTSFDWLDKDKTLFYMSAYGTEIFDLYHISGERLLINFSKIKKLKRNIIVEYSNKEISNFKWCAKSTTLQFIGFNLNT
jgi:hypothetical protein